MNLPIPSTGSILAGLGGVSLLLGLGAAVQTLRLHTAQARLETEQLQTKVLATAVSDRDAAIARQNAALDQIVKQQAEQAKAYQEALARANQRADSLYRQSDDILKQTTAAKDEVGRCRAALQLIQDTLSQPTPSN